MTHAYLNDLSLQELHREIVEARARLEDVIGSSVEHFSCPGGCYDARTLVLAKQAGYRSLATSRATANTSSSDPFLLGRVAILRTTSPTAFQEICGGEVLWRMRLGESLRGSARKVLGNALYDRVREALLQQP